MEQMEVLAQKRRHNPIRGNQVFRDAGFELLGSKLMQMLKERKRRLPNVDSPAALPAKGRTL